MDQPNHSPERPQQTRYEGRQNEGDGPFDVRQIFQRTADLIALLDKLGRDVDKACKQVGR